ncbi:hypothetical protein P8V03_06505 [Clostridium sp. A1-XYC3]|uniref:Uncharacterized protein n=1 Tax=Clostridium tanneri TaxID=3037988 RepID=A0ABU4JRP5_9CLOT|nr:hypothetical protein [Clostridium sp. A1-XYC3]MDW8800802.1 hypothetical protein [Clostridium sp. A1-XYC3]
MNKKLITFNSDTNKLYLDGKYVCTVEKSNVYNKSTVAKTASNGWEQIANSQFKLNFLGSESAAVIAGMIAAVYAFPPDAALIGGVGVIVGVAGFCSFKYREYWDANYRNPTVKHELDVYSDRTWSTYETTIRYTEFPQRG